MPQPPNTPALPQSVPLKYTRETKRLYCRGIDLNDPIDNIREGYYPILENLRSYTDGVIQPRQGITQVASSVITGQTPVHSVRRLNNPLGNTFTRLVGVGTKLAFGQSSFSAVQYNSVDVAFSGQPLAMMPWRPDQSPISWMYVADSTAMYKVTYNGFVSTTHQIGLAPPITAPIVELAAPIWENKITDFGTLARWGADGTVAGAVSINVRINTTISKILYDSGSFGWACVVPAAMTNIGPGTAVQFFDPAPQQSDVLIAEVYRGSSATSVATILYDNSPTNTGVCTIVPVAPLDELKRNCVVQLDSGGGNVYARVTEVIAGVNNTIAFRCSTGATTIAATQTLQVIGSFRGFVDNLYTAGETIQDKVGGGGASPASVFLESISGSTHFLTGWMKLTPTSPYDFTQMLTPVGGGGNSTTGITDFDYFHLSVKISDLSQFIQGRIIFDCGDGSFTQNYFYRAFTPSDLILASKATQTVLTTVNNANQNTRVRIGGVIAGGIKMGPGDDTNIGPSSRFSNVGTVGNPAGPDDPGLPPVDQTGTGDNQFSEIRFRRGDCIRVGTDWAGGWKAINAIRFEFTLIQGVSSPTSINVLLNSFTIWGGHAPDIGDIGAPYRYRYRYRVASTGVSSNWSPETRSGVFAFRSNTNITVIAPSAPEADIIDFQRWGGLVSQWADIGTTPINILTFTDTVSDDTAQATVADSVGDIHYQPWLIAQLPAKGTATTVAGTLIKDFSTNFTTSWVKGTTIKIGGLYTVIRRVISTSILEVEDCVGAQTSVAWEIPEPFIAAKPLPCMWNLPNGWFFACGDTTNPGRLYFSNKNDPDTTQDSFFLEVSSPSESLQNGFAYNGRCYVFSTERLYEIVEVATGQFIPRETAVSKGLLYRWAFCVGPFVWFLSKDGIYETDCGTAHSISHGELFPLFPKEGILGSAVNGFLAPNMINDSTVAQKFRLSYYDNYLYFNYLDTNSALRTLLYATGTALQFSMGQYRDFQRGWYPDVYTPGITYHYGEEGDSVHSLLLCGNDVTTGKLYTYGGATDNGTAIPWHFRQVSWDAGDKRADKIWGDFIVDANPGGGTISVAAGLNNYISTATLLPSTMTGVGRLQQVFDISNGNGVEAKNFAIDLAGTGTGAALYLLEPAFTFRPENSFLRATQYDDTGYEGEKFFQGIEIEADTLNIARTVRIEYDGGQLGDTLTINHNGRLQKPYSFASAFVAHLARMIPTDGSQWKLFKWRWVSEPEPPLVTGKANRPHLAI